MGTIIVEPTFEYKSVSFSFKCIDFIMVPIKDKINNIDLLLA